MSSNPVSERRWWHGWSLRARLLAGQLLVLTLVCFVIGTGTLLSLNNSQMSQLDGQLVGREGSCWSMRGTPTLDVG